MAEKIIITARMMEDDPSYVWAATGRYFGYPACCIAEYIQRHKEIMSTGILPPFKPEQKVLLDGNGFEPCPRCCSNTMADLDGSRSLSILIDNRHCAQQYPNGSLDPVSSRLIARNIQKYWDEYQDMLERTDPSRLPNFVKGGVI